MSETQQSRIFFMRPVATMDMRTGEVTKTPGADKEQKRLKKEIAKVISTWPKSGKKDGE